VADEVYPLDSDGAEEVLFAIAHFIAHFGQTTPKNASEPLQGPYISQQHTQGWAAS